MTGAVVEPAKDAVPRRGRDGRGISPLAVLRIALLYAVTTAFLFPFYVAVVYAFKTPQESAADPLGFPTSLRFDNFSEALGIPFFFNNIVNSIIVAAAAVTITVVSCSMAAYVITRRRGRVLNVLYYLFLLSILVPFQTIMFPLYVQMRNLGLINQLPSVIIVHAGVQVGFYVFLYAGFIKTIPVELEEAAKIDGASQYRIFFQVVFPLLKPITMTVIVLAALGSWNDFLAPLILLQAESARTLPLVQFYFFGQYSQEINLAFAAAIISMIPILLLYFVLQRYIVGGILRGAIKG